MANDGSSMYPVGSTPPLSFSPPRAGNHVVGKQGQNAIYAHKGNRHSQPSIFTIAAIATTLIRHPEELSREHTSRLLIVETKPSLTNSCFHSICSTTFESICCSNRAQERILAGIIRMATTQGEPIRQEVESFHIYRKAGFVAFRSESTTSETVPQPIRSYEWHPTQERDAAICQRNSALDQR